MFGFVVYAFIIAVGCVVALVEGFSSSVVFGVSAIGAITSILVGVWCWWNDDIKEYRMEDIRQELRSQLCDDAKLLPMIREILYRIDKSNFGKGSSVLRGILILAGLSLLSLLLVAVTGGANQSVKTVASMTGMVNVAFSFVLFLWEYCTMSRIPYSEQSQLGRELRELANDLNH